MANHDHPCRMLWQPLFYSIPFHSILFYSILFYSLLFYSNLICSDEGLTIKTCYSPNLTGEKHTISTLVDQTHFQFTHQYRKKQLFSKLVFQALFYSVHPSPLVLLSVTTDHFIHSLILSKHQPLVFSNDGLRWWWRVIQWHSALESYLDMSLYWK